MSPAEPTDQEQRIGERVVSVQIVARTLREARRMLRGVKKKYPKVELDELLKTVQMQSAYPNDAIKLSLSFGGEVAGRSLVKSVLCMARFKTKLRAEIVPAEDSTKNTQRPK